MLNNYLKNLYRSKVVSKEILTRDLSNWSVNQNTLAKKFTFGSFQEAMTFLSLATIYTKDHNIKAKFANVYNTIHVEINETSLNQITENEYKAALHFNDISKIDHINNLVEKDYYTTVRASRCERDANNALPTDLSDKRAFLAGADKLKLI